jgi:hypothetical protein
VVLVLLDNRALVLGNVSARERSVAGLVRELVFVNERAIVRAGNVTNGE